MYKALLSISLQNNIRLSQQIALRSCATNASAEKIVIPNRIQRGPTDILHALSSTVGNDPTAAHYKYHDDPYLIPMSNIGKRTFALAKEAGRKAAIWVRQEHSDMFQHQNADPPIAAYAPQMVYSDDSEVDAKTLTDLIESAEVDDAVFVYKLMKGKNMELSNELKQNLLEMLCFSNQENTLSDDYIEERWFRQSGSSGKERQRKTWKDGQLAEELFNELTDVTGVHAYSAIIRGMCKYHQVEKAWALFQDAQQKGLELNTDTYNSIIEVAGFLKESGEMRWQLCNDMLQQMNKAKLLPNLGTLNACMSTISTIGNSRLSRNAALSVLSEFKNNLNITPSLATWYFVLSIFCRERGPVSHVLVDILTQIENKEFKITDLKDTFFFVTAMDVCRNHLHDNALAKRVDKLLHFGDNYNLIGDSFKESIYYRHYFALLCQTEPLESFMEMYHVLVPNIYIPEPGVMAELLKAIDANGAFHLVPEIWSHMVMFDHTNRESLLMQILHIMISNKPSDVEDPMNEKFGDIAWDIYSKFEEQTPQRQQKLAPTGQLLGEVLSLVARSKDFERASQVFQMLDKNQHKIAGAPPAEALGDYIRMCVDQKQPTKAVNCLQYCVDFGMPDCAALARIITESLTIDETLMAKIESLVGKEALEKK